LAIPVSQPGAKEEYLENEEREDEEEETLW
jgi:hypothetical protein